MTTLAIRHGHSEANVQGGPAFNDEGAPLDERGRAEAQALIPILTSKPYDIGILTTPVAVSRLFRTEDTALHVGFQHIERYKVLNEVEGLTLKEVNHIRATKELTRRVLLHSAKLLNNPPKEKVWIMSALNLAGVCKLLDIYQDPDGYPWPDFCEIRELPL
jgi:broad specificity phosphatase PhoE